MQMGLCIQKSLQFHPFTFSEQRIDQLIVVVDAGLVDLTNAI
jgi:hypothetical protein